jgi:hypothetical protein
MIFQQRLNKFLLKINHQQFNKNRENTDVEKEI